ncbi:hypothetical protein LMG29542_07323 [Paraburkholderia humisilvae]|uniref:Uncharacterized protein n=2 Tax=Paraburkholderia humisilvae TaxID=627669 RepID=A0A6J5F3Z4_9BURK|nr:hypothetical protein LMG29542_07323 [Paraburkholderia humisilvae]
MFAKERFSENAYRKERGLQRATTYPGHSKADYASVVDDNLNIVWGKSKDAIYNQHGNTAGFKGPTLKQPLLPRNISAHYNAELDAQERAKPSPTARNTSTRLHQAASRLVDQIAVILQTPVDVREQIRTQINDRLTSGISEARVLEAVVEQFARSGQLSQADSQAIMKLFHEARDKAG